MLGTQFGHTCYESLVGHSAGDHSQNNRKDLIWNHNFISYRLLLFGPGSSPRVARAGPQSRESLGQKHRTVSISCTLSQISGLK